MTPPPMLVHTSATQDHIGVAIHGWKAVAATVTGPWHRQRGKPGQDAFALVLSEPLAVVALCDGAGSAPHGLTGASLASRQVAEGLLAALLDDATLTRERVAHGVTTQVAQVRHLLATLGDPRHYATTLVGAVTSRAGGFFFHIGDGAGVALPADWHKAVVSPPETGEYHNETRFLTDDDWQDHVRLTPFQASDDQVLLVMSDGVTPFAMKHHATQPDARFLGPVCRYLAATDDASHALQGTLACREASQVSHDDKTLIFLMRSPATP